MTDSGVGFLGIVSDFIEVEKFFLAALEDRDFNGVVAKRKYITVNNLL